MIMIMMITPWTAWPTCSASSWDWRWPPWPCWVSWPAPRWGAPSPGPSPAGPGAADTLGRRGCCPPWRCSSGRPSPTRRCSGTAHWQSQYLLPAGQRSEDRSQRSEVRGLRLVLARYLNVAWVGLIETFEQEGQLLYLKLRQIVYQIRNIRRVIWDLSVWVVKFDANANTHVQI